MLVAIFCDLTGSTAETRRYGALRTSGQIEARLKEIHAVLLEADPDLMVVAPMGDGAFYAGKRPSELFRAALAVQGRWSGLREGLPARITFGYGEGVWIGEPWKKDSTVRGTFVDLSARLLTVCPSGGILVTGGMYALLSENPEIRERLHEREAELKGLGMQPYWLVNGGTLGVDESTIPPVEPAIVATIAAPPRRRASDFSEHPGGIATFDMRRRKFSIEGIQMLMAVGLLILVFYHAGAFARWGVDPRPTVIAPAMPADVAETVRTLQRRMPASQSEHDKIIQQQVISNYLLAECLRKGGDCPRLSRPPGLNEMIERRPP